MLSKCVSFLSNISIAKRNILFLGHWIVDLDANFGGEKSPKQTLLMLCSSRGSPMPLPVAQKLMISQTQVISHDLFMIYDLVTHYPNMQNVTCY